MIIDRILFHPHSDILPEKKTSENMPSANQKPRTLYDKVFEAHIVDERDDGTILLYIGKCSTA